MIDIFNEQARFMYCCGQPFNEETAGLYVHLIKEEVAEFLEAFDEGDQTQQFKELCDVLVVIAGFAAAKDFPMGIGMGAVYRSNFSKINPETMKPYEVRADGKVLKGPHYVPPNLEEVLAANV